MPHLPIDYLKQMREILPDEYELFLDSYRSEPYRGFRVNSLKVEPEDFVRSYSDTLGFSPERVPWCPDGYYAPNDVGLSKLSLFYAGLFYIQEPSAMAPVEFLDIQKGMKILDLCAAPGGKSIQIASKLRGEGLLVSNDLSLKRARAILRNIEIFGVKNAIVTNASPEQLQSRFTEYFDRILVDAPCSGEGMFRKEPELIKSYSRILHNITETQLEILKRAAQMLKATGRMVYSTCTFNPAENENIIEKFLEEHPNFETIDPFQQYPIIKDHGFQKGHSVHSARLYPHKFHGEGHFFAVLKKTAPSAPAALKTTDNAKKNPYCSHNKKIKNEKRVASSKNIAPDFITPWQKFLEENTNMDPCPSASLCGDSLYHEILQEPERIDGIRVLRNGLFLGDIKNKEFVPSSAFIMSENEDVFRNKISFSADDPLLYKYLRCETLYFDLPDGLYVVCLDRFPLGMVKIKNKQAKNMYNKNWRLL